MWYAGVVLTKEYPMSVEIPSDLQMAIEAVVASGVYANEQELVSDILRAVVPALGQYHQLRRDVQASLDEVQQGKVRNADFDAIRQQLCKEYDEAGNQK
jgi:Arc/MetJ-type ribon-helix-helix transcriptional regulator